MRGRVLSSAQDTEAGQGVNNPESGLLPSLRGECGGGKPLARILTPRMRGCFIFLGRGARAGRLGTIGNRVYP